jgi:hypothetical protein
MFIRAAVFILISLETGSLAGFAVVCVEARYASVAWHGADRLEQRHATVEMWKELAQEFGLGLPSGPIEKGTVLARLITGGRSGIAVQYLSVDPVEVASPGGVADALDAFLRLRAGTVTGSRGGVTTFQLPRQ